MHSWLKPNTRAGVLYYNGTCTAFSSRCKHNHLPVTACAWNTVDGEISRNLFMRNNTRMWTIYSQYSNFSSQPKCHFSSHMYLANTFPLPPGKVYGCCFLNTWPTLLQGMISNAPWHCQTRNDISDDMNSRACILNLKHNCKVYLYTEITIQWWFVYPDTFVPSWYFRINEISGLLNRPLVQT